MSADPKAQRRHLAVARAAERRTSPQAAPAALERVPAQGEWKCDACGHIGPWDDGWRWFGYYRIIGQGYSASEKEVIEAVRCPDCPNAEGYELES